MTKEEFEALADRFDKATSYMSFQHMIAKTPEFASLMNAGKEIVPWIIEAFERYAAAMKRSEGNWGPGWHWGMRWVLVLEGLTHERPLDPEPVPGTIFVKWDVDETCRAWIRWANKQKGVPEFKQF